MLPHGLAYPPHLLDVLPVLDPQTTTRPQPSRVQHTMGLATHNTGTHPIRALSAKQFSDLHLQHTLAHPPDNALFPFLHGLEGDNHAQNTFFASSSFATAAGSGTGYSPNNNGRQHHHHHHHDPDGNPTHKITPRVPYHRGLVWVVCEEDLERAGDYTTLRVLRRKPVNSSSAHSSAGTAGNGLRQGEDDESQEILDAACAPSSSESSEECSDGSSSYGDEDEDIDDDDEEDANVEEEEVEMEMALDEDEQDMLLMLQVGNTAAAAAAVAVAKAKLSVAKPKGDVNSGSSNNVNGDDTDNKPSPDLELDIDLDDEDDEDSILASPVLATGGPGNGVGGTDMQMDVVHVVIQGESESEGDQEGKRSGMNTDMNTNTKPKPKKDEKHFEGPHMHPVAARRIALAPPTTMTSTVTATATGTGTPATVAGNGSVLDVDDTGLPPPLPLPIPLALPVGLGIDTSGMRLGLGSTASSSMPPPQAREQSQSGAAGGSPTLSPLSACSSSSASSSMSSSTSSSTSTSSCTEASLFLESSNSNTTSSSLSSASSFVNAQQQHSSLACPTTMTPSPLSQAHSSEQEGDEPLSLLELDLETRSRSRSRSRGPSPESVPSRSSPPPPMSSSSSPSLESESSPPAPSSTTSKGTTTTTTTTTTSSLTSKKSTPTPSSSPKSLSPRPTSMSMSKVKLRRPTDPSCPPLLTSTFRPKELLRRCKSNLGADVNAGLGLDEKEREEREREKRRVGVPRLRVDVGGVKDQENKNEKEKEGQDEEEGRWEFVPARVPDGISLRNFGIQVPIYATLSDIVIYSPYGVTPASLSLARRFRAAIRGKRAERLDAAGLGPSPSFSASTSSSEPPSESQSNTEDQHHGHQHQHHHHTHHHHPIQNSAEELDKRREEFVEYNVFVLDATEEEMRKEVPHLMMRVCGAGVPGGSSNGLSPGGGGGGGDSLMAKTKKANGDTSRPLVDVGAHTDGPDGHVVEQERMKRLERDERMKKKGGENEGGGMGMDMDLDVVGDMDVDAMDVDEVKLPHDSALSPKEGAGEKTEKEQDDDREDDLHLILNTVDFALREREEMRDLTKASEIISLPPLVPPVSGARASVSTSGARPTMSTDADTDLAGPVWDPCVGQVYLGNSGDVPLAPDVPSHFRHAASVAGARARSGSEQEEEEERAKRDWTNVTRHLLGVDGLMKEHEVDFGIDEGGLEDERDQEERSSKGTQPLLAEDDPFNYLATNDPVYGFGYDICVECHDLAPFPSAAHLRAAEEHLGMLDVMWRERWERAWAERVHHLSQLAAERGASEEEQRRIRSCPPPPTPPRPPPHANAVIHLPFPSSPQNTQATMVSLMPIVRFLEKWIQPLLPVITPPPPPPPPSVLAPALASSSTPASASASSRRWSSVTALMPSFPSFPGMGGSSGVSDNNSSTNPAPTPPPNAPLPPHPARVRSLTGPSTSSIPIHPPTPVQARSRPLKILLYSSDGYTESSVPALCLLMAIKSLMLPEAYLELQVEKRRSFFVYQTDLGVLRRVEARLKEEREREKEKERERERERERMAVGVYLSSSSSTAGGSINANGKRTASGPVVIPARGGYWSSSGNSTTSNGGGSTGSSSSSSFMGRPAAKSVSFAHAPGYMASIPSASTSQYSQPQQQQHSQQQISPTEMQGSSNVMLSQQIASASQYGQKPQFEFGSLPSSSASAFTTQQPQPQAPMTSVIKGRPRASTSPWLPSLFGGDHQSWFNDPRFDGSFPSRVLPFLYLGNLNHASNVYMLHALGITHVVSVGECALVPPPHHMSIHGGNTAAACHRPGPGAHFVPGKGPGGHGSLWIEEREGRIKVLDIKGVCDDGIDTLEPQLEPICDWIDKARQEGGQVLVHCRVGVSRSATVTIAYVMKHLSLPLVDAYLIVRSRRLSVLIQPNMRLLYNLCGWEIKLAKERAGGDERKLKRELARTLTWPYLSKEVHALNEKYLH